MVFGHHNIVSIMLFLLGYWLPQITAAQASYSAREDVATWLVMPSRLLCTLKQPIPDYGEAVFSHEAGEPLNFTLRSQRPFPRADQATVGVQSPYWAVSDQNKHLSVVAGKAGSEPVRLGEHLASALLEELQSGQFPVIRHAGWVLNQPVEVMVSAVNFTQAYNTFAACVSELFPANFRQLERTSLLFDTDKSDIKAEFYSRLDLLVGYLDVDTRVNKIFVDGHTDNVGGNGYNWDLSQRRAKAVVKYLKDKGLEDDQVVMRYHGEMLPITDNKTANKRARNRRVTLRLASDVDT